MRVVVSGSSGMIGQALLELLRVEGHEVVPLVRRSTHRGEARWDPSSGSIDDAALDGCDAAVNLAGVGIGDRRWSRKRKREIVESRVASTDLLSRTLGELSQRPRTLVSASAIGIYGDRGDEILTEDSETGEGFPAEVCEKWEAATAPAQIAGIRVAHLRSAVVLALTGGALARQLPLFRAGIGGRLGKGDQWFSWVSLRDEAKAILHILETETLSGAVNCSSPAPVTNREFTKALARALRRPAAFSVPRPALRVALGRKFADEFVLSSLRVLPSRLTGSGFVFEDQKLEEALGNALSGP